MAEPIQELKIFEKMLPDLLFNVAMIVSCVCGFIVSWFTVFPPGLGLCAFVGVMQLGLAMTRYAAILTLARGELSPPEDGAHT